MGVLLLVAVALAGSLPFGIYNTIGATRWTRRRAVEAQAPARSFVAPQSPRRGTNPLGLAVARSTTFLG